MSQAQPAIPVGSVQSNNEAKNTKHGLTDDISELIPFSACCCSVSSCFCKFPDCIGVETSGTLVCFNVDAVCCRCVSDDPQVCCVIQRCDWLLVNIRTCLECRSQVCCCDSRCALPCDDNVPCLFGMFFLICCQGFHCAPHCMKKLPELRDLSKA
jgi:hypothetical protein